MPALLSLPLASLLCVVLSAGTGTVSVAVPFVSSAPLLQADKANTIVATIIVLFIVLLFLKLNQLSCHPAEW